MKIALTVLLLVISNVFMTFAWYGNLKLSEMHIIDNWPLILIILASWGIALVEYMFSIPANRIGSESTGGPLTLVQLKVIQEVISLIVFTILSIKVFKMNEFTWNQFIAFIFLILAVFFIFKK